MKGPDCLEWTTFRLGDLFVISKGTRLTKAQMIPGKINYIGASSMNNGVTARIGNTERLFPAGMITVCYNGSVGESFYQPEMFWASDDVNVLAAKDAIDENASLFILPILKNLGKRYGFANKWRQDVMADELLYLPATSDGKPDWTHMSRYMQEMLDKTESAIDEMGEAYFHEETIDSSKWTPYKIGELFTILKGTRLTRANMEPGTTPFIGATLENNGVTAHVGNTDHLHPGGVITIAYLSLIHI